MSERRVFVIPGRLDGLNAYIGACRKNPHAGAAMKRKNQKRVLKAIAEWDVQPIETPVKVSVVWIEPNMRRDKDNIRSAIKYILDGMVEAGIIPGDGWKHVSDISDAYVVDRHNPRVVVEVSTDDRPSTRYELERCENL